MDEDADGAEGEDDDEEDDDDDDDDDDDESYKTVILDREQLVRQLERLQWI